MLSATGAWRPRRESNPPHFTTFVASVPIRRLGAIRSLRLRRCPAAALALHSAHWTLYPPTAP